MPRASLAGHATRPRDADHAARARRAGAGALVALALTLWTGPAAGWGFTGHRLVNARAVGTLPPELRALFEADADWLAEHGVDPDLWRGAGHEHEAPNHFINLDAFSQPPFSDVAHDETEHRRRLGARAAEVGRVPWRVGEVYAELVAAFRAGDVAGALRHAASLGHYVADAHVPLHALRNYDGQETGQQGLHARWESVLVERFEQQLAPQIEPGRATHIDDPTAFVLDALRASYAEAEGLFASDLACRGAYDLAETRADERYDDAYYSKMYAREERRLVARLTASAEAVGSLWRSAWEDAGRPSLGEPLRFAHVRGRSKAVLLSLDGASEDVLAAAMARGLMPHLARLRGAGARARGVLAPLPAKTAPSHAALFTGAWSGRNGVAANEQPRPQASLREFDSGFSAEALRAEPLWVSAARQGLRATVVTGPQSHPFEPFTSGKRFGSDFARQLTLINGYQTPVAADGVLDEDDALWDVPKTWPEALPEHVGALRTLSLRVGEATLQALLFDDPQDAASGFDTLLVRDARAGGTPARLKPLAAARDAAAFGRLVAAFESGRAALFLRLFELAPDGSRLLLYHAGAGVLKTSPATLEQAVLEETGGFVPNSAAWTYERGELGRTLAQGGDGSAEERYLETLALTLRQFGRLSDFARTRTAWHLLVAYVPLPDDFFHVWLGLLDASLASHDARLAARLQPYFERALGLLDDYLGALSAALPGDAYLAVAADHGQTGADHVLRANVALREAGLLTVGADGQIDPTRTRAALFRDAGFVVINRTARAQGLVAPEAEDDVVRRVRAALLGVRAPDGQRPVLDVLDRRQGGEFGAGPPYGGDLYLSLAPGYLASGALDGPLCERIAPRGHHQLDQTRPGLPSALVIHGPGIAGGGDLGLVRAIDVAPTLACLLGIDPPAQAEGQALRAACREHARP